MIYEDFRVFFKPWKTRFQDFNEIFEKQVIYDNLLLAPFNVILNTF